MKSSRSEARLCEVWWREGGDGSRKTMTSEMGRGGGGVGGGGHRVSMKIKRNIKIDR